MDFLAILICIGMLCGSLYLVTHQKCSHLWINYTTCRCISCGLGIREIYLHEPNFRFRKWKFTGKEDPISILAQLGVTVMYEVKLSEDGKGCLQSMCIPEDSPPIAKAIFSRMLLRRKGVFNHA